MLGRDELEVNSMDQGPDLPGSLAGREEVVLDLVGNDSDSVAVAKAKVGEEDGHEDGAPDNLVNTDLQGNMLRSRAFDLAIEPVVEVVARGSVVDKAKDGKGDETLNVKGASADKELKKDKNRSTV